MDWSTFLQNLGPGLGRPLGSGDVVPYRGASSNFGTVSNPEVATPGPSGPGAGAFGQDSFLNNLSSLMPAINAFIQAQNQVPSGQGTALPGAPNAATPGIGSADITAALNAQATGGAAGPAPTSPAAPAPAPALAAAFVPTAAPGSGGEGAPGGTPGTPSEGTPSGAPSEGGVGVGVGIGEGGASAPGIGSAGEGMRRGGLVHGKPTKGDSVSARLQPGEFVIPRDAVHHLAATRPDVLSHVMQVSAAHALMQKMKDAQLTSRNGIPPQPGGGAQLTGRNGGPPPQPSDGATPFAQGGMVIPRGAVPQINPAALEAIRRAIALHALVNQARQGAPALDRMVGPAQVATMSPATGQFGRPAVLPPLGPPPGP